MAPLRGPPGSEATTLGALVVVLVPRSCGPGLSATLAALAGQRGAETRIVCLHEGETGDEESVHWLGALWRGGGGARLPLSPSGLLPRGAPLILRGGGGPGARWAPRGGGGRPPAPRPAVAGT